MKKLVSVAMSLVAGLALAETAVESANIVGYIEKGFIEGYNNDVVSTFGKVGGEDLDDQIVLGDIKGNEYFSAANGDLLTVYVNGEAQFAASYFSKDLLEMVGLTVEEGWWDISAMADMSLFEDPNYCYNNYALPLGTGFTVNPSSSDSKLIFKGEVRGEVEVSYVSNQNSDTGVVIPVDCKLGDIKGNEYFSAANGDLLTVYVCGEAQFAVSYFSKDLLEMVGLTVEEGWWDISAMADMSLFEDPNYCYNNYALTAGQGFTVNTASDDSGLIFPDPQTLNSTK